MESEVEPFFTKPVGGCHERNGSGGERTPLEEILGVQD